MEQAPALRAGGQAVDLRGAAREVANRLGILDDIRRVHTGTRGLAYVDDANRQLARLPADLLGDSGGAIAELEILRSDLAWILHGVTRDDVEYVFGDTITDIAQGDDGAKASFERGAPRTVDLVVGADELHSGVRRLTFGGIAVRPRPRCLRRQLHHHQPAGPGRLGAAAQHARKDRGSVPAAADRPGDGGVLLRLAAARLSPPGPRSAAAAWPRRSQGRDGRSRLLDAMWAAPDFYFDRVAQVQMDRWSAGRVALVGDAAHSFSPLAGVGTSLALVGAYVLAGELAASAGDHRLAFAGYERQLRDFVNQGQQLAKANSGGLLAVTVADLAPQPVHPGPALPAVEEHDRRRGPEGGQRHHPQGLPAPPVGMAAAITRCWSLVVTTPAGRPPGGRGSRPGAGRQGGASAIACLTQAVA